MYISSIPDVLLRSKFLVVDLPLAPVLPSIDKFNFTLGAGLVSALAVVVVVAVASAGTFFFLDFVFLGFFVSCAWGSLGFDFTEGKEVLSPYKRVTDILCSTKGIYLVGIWQH